MQTFDEFRNLVIACQIPAPDRHSPATDLFSLTYVLILCQTFCSYSALEEWPTYYSRV